MDNEREYKMTADSQSQVYERGLKLAEEGRHDEAIGCIREHLRSQPSDFQAYNDIGVILYCMGNNDGAIEHFERAKGLCTESESVEINWNLCEAYLVNGQPGFALGLFDEMERQEILSADILNRAAEVFLAEESFGNAIEVLLRSLEKSPSQEILKPMIDVIQSKRPKVALFCNEINEQAEWLFDFLKKRFVAEIHVGNSRDEARPILEWCDIAFFDGYSKTLSDISYMQQTCRVVVRFDESDVYENSVETIHWGNVDTLILPDNLFVKETLFSKASDIEKQVRIVSIGASVDTESFKFSYRGQGKKIACMDDLSLKNNPMFLLQCMQKLVYIDNDYRLYFCGEFADKTTEDYLRYMVEELELSNAVFFDSGVPNAAAWLRDKHYVVTASISGSGVEGIAKGMSCGLKPLIHNFPGCSEIVDGEFVFNLAEDFCNLILSESYESARYRGIVEERYSQKTQTKTLNNILFKCEKEIAHEMPLQNLTETVKSESRNLPIQFGNTGASDVIAVNPTPAAMPNVNILEPAGNSEMNIALSDVESAANDYTGGDNPGSINRMSGDVLQDWRVFKDRMESQSSQSQPLDSMNMSPAGVTPLNLSSNGTVRGMKITEIPSDSSVCEEKHAPFAGQ